MYRSKEEHVKKEYTKTFKRRKKYRKEGQVQRAETQADGWKKES